MRIDPIARTVELSVGELAAFRNIPKSDSQGYQPWRAAVGQQWHKTSEAQLRQVTPEAKFEVPIQAIWRHREWSLQIQGRIDQIIPTVSGIVLREVKTVRAELPASEEHLMLRYTNYFAQLAIYWELSSALPEFDAIESNAELEFIDIENGAIQTVSLSPDHRALFTQQLDALIPFLNDRRDCRMRLEQARIHPAFETLREGQSKLFSELETASLQSKTTLLEAPTGFGKTGIVLEHALRQMQQGIFERCIYLTSKSTGQLETIRQLRHMIGENLRYVQMRNRKEHHIESSAHTCSDNIECDANIGRNWRAADIDPPELFREGTLSIERAKAIGAETGVCPYALTKGCLPFAEIWIGDLNYVFSPASQNVFFDQYGFDPAKTLLIIDEAHNLPDRTADTLSVELHAGNLLFVLEEIRAAGASRRLLAIGNELCRCIESQPKGRRLSTNAKYECLDLCEDFSRQLQETHFDFQLVAPFATEIIWRISQLVHCLNEPDHQWLYWVTENGCLRATCLDASDWITRNISTFGSTILMSATLSPSDSFRDSCGLKKEDVSLAIGHASWRREAYQVAIDCRVDTRYKQRDKHYLTTAETIAFLIHQSPGIPVAVFFSSYQYAENVKAYLNTFDSTLRAMIQPRGVDLSTQENFIDEGLILADALFLILGSSYAEGVDKLGGRINTVMIVGPALAEVNLIQESKLQAHPDLSHEVSFRDVYIIPAMRRIHQALGRIVRAPGQKANVLLHGRRFAEPIYYQQLAEEYQAAREIHTDADIIDWWSSL